MNRLQSELHRLYLPRSEAPDDTATTSPALIGPSGMVRALVMELTDPPSWQVLAAVWHGVQTELDLPAPAIAVSGLDGMQLWFSLSEPVSIEQARGFLEGLRTRFLPDIKPSRVRLMPASDASAAHSDRHALLVPACQASTGNWSAFVAPDLAPVFTETPWIDIPPNEDGQAALLRMLDMMKPAVFEAALARLAPSTPEPLATAGSTRVDAHRATEGPAHATEVEAARRFLFQVMNDDTLTLAHRIEAAKALLQPRH